MQKRVELWSIQDLQSRFYQIQFPEYQREPNLWSITEKQRLIDSMTRQFDIASLYFYQHDTGQIDCVDGRQRIGAIMAFLGIHTEDDDADFPFRALNEIHSDDGQPFLTLEGKTFSEIRELADRSESTIASQFVERILTYRPTIVMLSDSKAPTEFNLQFTRLNLGTIINSGEKLHAMVGDFRDACFHDLGKHSFLRGTSIPTRRFAREQVAAQLLAQIFSLEENGTFARTRHFDLQRVFKRYGSLDNSQRILIQRLSKLFDLLLDAFESLDLLRNRAITVSTVLLAWRRDIESADEAKKLAMFVEDFLDRLGWQVDKGLMVDQEYHYLIEFQRHITQASAERSSVLARAILLEAEFNRWTKDGELRGDKPWRSNNPGKDPRRESRS